MIACSLLRNDFVFVALEYEHLTMQRYMSGLMSHSTFLLHYCEIQQEQTLCMKH